MVLSLYKLAINPSYPKLTVKLIHMDNLQIDKDKDGFVSLDEFMTASKTDEFEKDDGWKSVEEEHPYTDDELAEFERQLQEEEKLKMAQQQAAEDVKNVATKIAEVGLMLNSFRLDQKHSVMHCNVLNGSAFVPVVSGPGSSPGQGHRVVFLGKTLNSHSASLHPGV